MTTVAVAGQTFTFGVGLWQQADTKLLQAAPTIAAGDFQRSINGAGFGNLDNLPTVTPAAGTRVQIVLSAAETTAAVAGGEIWVRWIDAVGAEWCDGYAVIKIHAAEIGAACTVSAIDNNVITAASIADGAIDAATFAADALCAVWTCATRTLTGFGTLVSDLVAALMSQSAIAKALRSYDLALYRGDTWSQVITGLGDLTAATDIWFGIKADPDDTDNEAIVLISETTGLERINGAAAAVPANGSITVVGAATDGVIQVDLDEAETAKLVPDKRFWDCQKLVTGTVTTPRAGRILITADIVRATS